MKKRMVFLAMMVCVLAFGLVFIGCKSDGGGGLSIPSLAGFKAADFAGIDLVFSGSAVTEATAEAVIIPIVELLKQRYDDLSDFIKDKLGGDGAIGSFNKDLSDYKNDTDLTDYGIENLAGSTKGSANSSGGSGTFNLTHDYDSDNDIDSFDFIGSNTVKGKVKGAGNNMVKVSANSQSDSEAVALSYAVAFNYGSNSGYAIVTVGWAYEWVYLLATDTINFTSVPLANVKVDLYDTDGSFLRTQSYTGEDAIEMLGLDELF